MTRLPRLTGPELLAALQRAGFSVVRVRGSHRTATWPTLPSLHTIPFDFLRRSVDH
jgi:predicted RNA binding protein YcfA (HicA-like mRNA interferase family)